MTKTTNGPCSSPSGSAGTRARGSSPAEVRKSAEPVRARVRAARRSGHLGRPGPWLGKFLPTDRGQLISAKSLGKLLTGQVGRFHGPYVVRSGKDTHTKTQVDRVEKVGAASPWTAGNPPETPHGTCSEQEGNTGMTVIC